MMEEDAGFSDIGAARDDRIRSRRRICNSQVKKATHLPSTRRDGNRFEKLRIDEVAALCTEAEVNAVNLVHEVVHKFIQEWSRVCCFSRRTGVARTRSKKAVKLAAAHESAIRVAGDGKSEFF